MQRADGGVSRGQYAGASNASDQFLAELRCRGAAAPQDAQRHDIPALLEQFRRYLVMRWRTRADGNIDIGQKVEGHIGAERVIADRLDVDAGDAAPINVAPHREALVLGKFVRRNVHTALRSEILHRSPGLATASPGSRCQIAARSFGE